MVRPLIAFGGTTLMIVGIFALWQLTHPTDTYTQVPLPPSKLVSQSAAVITAATTTPATSTPTMPPPPELGPVAPTRYLEITKGCSISVNKDCVRAMSRPSTTSTPRTPLRIGSLLYIKGSTTTSDGTLWYELDFPEALRYSDRLTLPWFIEASAGTVVLTDGPSELTATTSTTSKQMIVDRSDQLLLRYDGDTLVATHTISTGRELTPTPRGTFTIFRKTPSRYMQGPIPGISTNYYDLPGVPWNLYFTKQGAVVHGAYWHNNFGRQYSNGCVNLPPALARTVYEWAPLGTTITVRD